MDLIEHGALVIAKDTTVTKTLNVDKIKDLEDVKRVLKFLNINVTINGCITPTGFYEVRDLFER